jgi:hypothetical protein
VILLHLIGRDALNGIRAICARTAARP